MATNIQLLAYDKAVAFLNAAGAAYIVMAPGDVFCNYHSPTGAVELKAFHDNFTSYIEPLPLPVKPHHTRVITNNFVKQTNYVLTLRSLEVGQEASWNRATANIATGRDWDSFTSCVSSQMKRSFGAIDETWIRDKSDEQITVLRVS